MLCPTCAVVSELHRPPVTDCAHCHTPYPDALRTASDASLRRSMAPKPVLLSIGQWLSLFTGGVFVLLTLLAPLNIGTYSISGEEMPGPQFLLRGGWLMGVLGGLLLGIAVGLLRDRPWARPLMLLYWMAFALLALIGDGFDIAALMASALVMIASVAIAAWYLYAKPDVRAYFEARSASGDERGV